MPKVTIIIPSYNHAPYLDRRIQSILQQTFQDFNIVIIDDCSTDNSGEIIEKYAQQDNRIKVIINDKNSGSTFCQWNKGVNLADGEYIWIAESDDYAENTFLETLNKKLDAHPTAALAYCQSWIVDEKDTILYSGVKWYEKISNNAKRWQNDFFNKGIDECANYLSVHCTIFNASAVLFRKHYYEKAGPANENFKFAGDWLQWVKMLMIADVVFVAIPLNYFRKHQQTTRHNSYLEFNDLAEHYQVMKFIADRTYINKNILKNASLYGRWKTSSNSPISFNTIKNLYSIYNNGKHFDPLIIRRLLSYFKLKITQK